MSRLSKGDVMGLLQEHGAIVEGHFRLPSGLHSPTYIQTAVVLQYPHLANKIAKALTAKFAARVDVVLAPTPGSVVLGQEVARELKCRSIFAERAGGALSLKRDFKLKAGERALVVTDVLTTGRATAEAAALAGAWNCKVVGVAAIVDRSTGPLPFAIPVRALLDYPLKVSAPEQCDQCLRQVPLATPAESSPALPQED